MKQESKAKWALIFSTMMWGMGFPLTSLTLKHMGAFTLVSVKNLLAAALLLLVFRKNIPRINRELVKAAFFIALTLVVGNILQTGAMVYTTPSKCSFISGLVVVFVPIIMTVIYKKPPTRKKIFSIFVALVGLFLLTYNGDHGINRGDLLTLISAFIYSFQVIMVDRFGKKVDALMLAAVEVFFVGIMSLPVGIYFEGYHIAIHQGIVVVCILVTGLLGTGVGMAAQNKMQPYISPSHAALIYLCEPVFGAFFSIFIGDILSLRAIGGAILILAAMFLEQDQTEAPLQAQG